MHMQMQCTKPTTSKSLVIPVKLLSSSLAEHRCCCRQTPLSKLERNSSNCPSQQHHKLMRHCSFHSQNGGRDNEEQLRLRIYVQSSSPPSERDSTNRETKTTASTIPPGTNSGLLQLSKGYRRGRCNSAHSGGQPDEVDTETSMEYECLTQSQSDIVTATAPGVTGSGGTAATAAPSAAAPVTTTPQDSHSGSTYAAPKGSLYDKQLQPHQAGSGGASHHRKSTTCHSMPEVLKRDERRSIQLQELLARKKQQHAQQQLQQHQLQHQHHQQQHQQQPQQQKQPQRHISPHQQKQRSQWQPLSPQNQVRQPLSPQTQVRQPLSPQCQVRQPLSPQCQVRQPLSPQTQVRQHRSGIRRHRQHRMKHHHKASSDWPPTHLVRDRLMGVRETTAASCYETHEPKTPGRRAATDGIPPPHWPPQSLPWRGCRVKLTVQASEATCQEMHRIRRSARIEKKTDQLLEEEEEPQKCYWPSAAAKNSRGVAIGGSCNNYNSNNSNVNNSSSNNRASAYHSIRSMYNWTEKISTEGLRQQLARALGEQLVEASDTNCSASVGSRRRRRASGRLYDSTGGRGLYSLTEQLRSGSSPQQEPDCALCRRERNYVFKKFNRRHQRGVAVGSVDAAAEVPGTRLRRLGGSGRGTADHSVCSVLLQSNSRMGPIYQDLGGDGIDSEYGGVLPPGATICNSHSDLQASDSDSTGSSSNSELAEIELAPFDAQKPSPPKEFPKLLDAVEPLDQSQSSSSNSELTELELSAMSMDQQLQEQQQPSSPNQQQELPQSESFNSGSSDNSDRAELELSPLVGVPALVRGITEDSNSSNSSGSSNLAELELSPIDINSESRRVRTGSSDSSSSASYSNLAELEVSPVGYVQRQQEKIAPAAAGSHRRQSATSRRSNGPMEFEINGPSRRRDNVADVGVSAAEFEWSAKAPTKSQLRQRWPAVACPKVLALPDAAFVHRGSLRDRAGVRNSSDCASASLADLERRRRQQRRRPTSSDVCDKQGVTATEASRGGGGGGGTYYRWQPPVAKTTGDVRRVQRKCQTTQTSPVEAFKTAVAAAPHSSHRQRRRSDGDLGPPTDVRAGAADAREVGEGTTDGLDTWMESLELDRTEAELSSTAVHGKGPAHAKGPARSDGPEHGNRPTHGSGPALGDGARSQADCGFGAVYGPAGKTTIQVLRFHNPSAVSSIEHARLPPIQLRPPIFISQQQQREAMYTKDGLIKPVLHRGNYSNSATLDEAYKSLHSASPTNKEDAGGVGKRHRLMERAAALSYATDRRHRHRQQSQLQNAIRHIGIGTSG